MNINPYKLWTLPDNPPVKTDCLVVLSYAVADRINPTVPTKTILKLAYSWWKKFPRSYVIMSTGDNQKLGVPNSLVMAGYAKTVGIPESRMIPESSSRNTVENLQYSFEMARRRKFKNITLILYDLHVRRTLAVAKKIGLQDFSWVSTGSPGSPAYGIKYFQTYNRMTIFIYEFLAYIYNLFRGEL